MKRVFLWIIIGLLIVPMWYAVPAQAADIPLAAAVETVSGPLNVRKEASTSSAVLTRMAKGSILHLIAREGAWWRVEYAAGRYGYCAASYLNPILSAYSATVGNVREFVNLRSGPGTSYTKLGTLAKGREVIVLSAQNGWCRVLYSGSKIAYISSRYLTETLLYPAVTLDVVHIRQGDSRWAAATLGSSGQTIARIGCTTCCVAMLESYQTGRFVRPDELAATLKYTEGGALYWPDSYTFYTGNDYLARIYDLLAHGKPVIVGGKTAEGRQHWVVVTGYQGGSTLTASGFLIRDPAGVNRTNLQQLFRDYPVFHRMAYRK